MSARVVFLNSTQTVTIVINVKIHIYQVLRYTTNSTHKTYKTNYFSATVTITRLIDVFSTGLQAHCRVPVSEVPGRQHLRSARRRHLKVPRTSMQRSFKRRQNWSLQFCTIPYHR